MLTRRRVGGSGIFGSSAYGLDIDGEACAVYRTDIEVIEEVGGAGCGFPRLIEGPFGDGGGSGWSELRFADVVYAAGSAGFALRFVRRDVVAATGTRPDIRSNTALWFGVGPGWRDVDGQDISVVGRREGLHDPGSFSWEDRGERLASGSSRVCSSKDCLVGTVDQLHDSDRGRRGLGGWQILQAGIRGGDAWRVSEAGG